MKRVLSGLLAILILTAGAYAQGGSKPLRKVMTLPMPGENGSNGASVVWHPVQKKYYSAIAGNATFTFAIFDAAGKQLTKDEQEPFFDTRGMWYEPVTKSIQANGYNEFGWIQYKLDKKGLLPLISTEDGPDSDVFTQLQEGMVQPEEQSVGFLDVKTKRICFLSGSNIVQYNQKGVALDDVIELKIAVPEEMDEEADPMENYNNKTVCYTGLPNAEFALHNITNNEIELYNRKGAKTKSLKLPDGAPANSMFNFAYANGIWWLFDKDERKWIGYK